MYAHRAYESKYTAHHYVCALELVPLYTRSRLERVIRDIAVLTACAAHNTKARRVAFTQDIVVFSWSEGETIVDMIPCNEIGLARFLPPSLHPSLPPSHDSLQ